MAATSATVAVLSAHENPDELVENESPQVALLQSRAYQLEMLEKSKKDNIIVVMHTGSGKTQIARLRIDFELQRNPDKLCWFLAQSQVLAQQQHKFLSEQLPSYSFRLITGADYAEYWATQAIWDAALMSHNGVVSTPQILLDALSHGFVLLDKLSLLVFDEAHHCIGKNPYNKIMEFVRKRYEQKKHCPHVLGLTATPMINDDIGLIAKVESHLLAVCTSPTVSVEQYTNFVNLPKLVWLPFTKPDGQGSILLRPLEMLLRTYRLDDDPTIIRLQQSSDAHDQQALEKYIRKKEPPTKFQIKDLFNKSRYIEENLGSWATDRYIYACISKLASCGAAQQEYLFTVDQNETLHLNKLLSPLLSVSIAAQPEEQDFTTKAQALFGYLRALDPDKVTGVLFVQRRSMAYALHELLSRTVALQGYRSFTFVGCSNPMNRMLADLADLGVQQTEFADFRGGKRNLAIATEVLQEGIDVQACNLVLSFDAPSTTRAYVQRRGRARHSEAKFVIMIEGKQPSTEHLPFHAIETEMQRICAEENRKLQEKKTNQSLIDEQLDFAPICTAKAIIEVDNVLQHLAHFCATLTPRVPNKQPRPLYLLETSKVAGVDYHRCEVVLPHGLPPELRRTSSSNEWRTESAARKDAAFQSYQALFGAELLNEHLLPLHAEARRLTQFVDPIESRDGLVNTRSCFDVWAECRAAMANRSPLFAYEVSIDGKASVLMLLPFNHPGMDFRIFATDGRELPVQVHGLADAVGDVYSIASKITKFLYQSVLRRRLPGLDLAEHELPYFIVPNVRPETLQSWLTEVSRRRTPLSKYELSDHEELLIYENRNSVPYFLSASQNSKPLGATVTVTRMARTINLLKRNANTAAPKIRELPVGDCFVSSLSPSIAYVMSLMPTIAFKVETALRSQAAIDNTILGKVGLTPSTLDSAFVSPQADNRSNYQLLEFLGDVILKYLATVNVLCNNPLYSEGALTIAMNRLVNNARLHRSMLELGLDQYITFDRFSGDSWTLAPIESVGRNLSSKLLGDVVEAIIGAASQADKVFEVLSVLLPEVQWQTPEEDISRLHMSEMPKVLDDSPLLQDVQTLIGYRFNQPVLLAEALNHSSMHLPLQCYERLEFLGDSILDMIVKKELFFSQHNFSEATMSLARHALVNADILSFLTTQIAVEIRDVDIAVDFRSKAPTTAETTRLKRLHDFLFREPSAQLASQRAGFLGRYDDVADSIQNALTNSKDWPWADLFHLKSPKWASDVLESIIGAVFIDSMGNLDECCTVLTTLGLMPLVSRAACKPDMDYRQKRQVLYEARPGRVKFVNNKYRANGGQGEELCRSTVKIDGKEVAMAEGCSCKDEAEERAAIEALRVLESEEEEKEQKKKLDGDLSLEEISNADCAEMSGCENEVENARE